MSALLNQGDVLIRKGLYYRVTRETENACDKCALEGTDDCIAKNTDADCSEVIGPHGCLVKMDPLELAIALVKEAENENDEV